MPRNRVRPCDVSRTKPRTEQSWASGSFRSSNSPQECGLALCAVSTPAGRRAVVLWQEGARMGHTRLLVGGTAFFFLAARRLKRDRLDFCLCSLAILVSRLLFFFD